VAHFPNGGWLTFRAVPTVVFRWQLDSPSFEKGQEDKHEARRGLDVLHFGDGKIVQKLT